MPLLAPDTSATLSAAILALVEDNSVLSCERQFRLKDDVKHRNVMFHGIYMWSNTRTLDNVAHRPTGYTVHSDTLLYSYPYVLLP